MKLAIVAAASILALAGTSASAATLTGNLTADNAFFAYVSTSAGALGTLVGSGNDWGSTFNLASTQLNTGAYYLNIEAINYGGPGAFIGDFTLTGGNGTVGKFANGSSELLTDTTNWNSSFNNTNADPYSSQPWVTPTGGIEVECGYNGANACGAQNGIGPWGGVANVSSNAQWIWANDSSATNGCQYLNGGYCTVDLSTKFTVAGVPEPSTWAMMLVGLGGLGLALRSRRRQVAAIA
jgi:hypothetical protein